MTYRDPHVLLSIGNLYLLKIDVLKVDRTRPIYSLNICWLYLFQFICHLNLEVGCVLEAQLFFHRISIGISGGLWHNVK